MSAEKAVASLKKAEADGGGLSTAVKDGPDGQVLTLTLSGRLDAAAAAFLWRPALGAWKESRPALIKVDASEVSYCDGAGIGLLMELLRRQKKNGGRLEIIGLAEEFQRLLDLFDPAEFETEAAQRTQPSNILTETGRTVYLIWRDAVQFIAFVGELSLALLQAARRPNKIRWSDTLRICESTGVNALPIIALISFLVGLIMAFQAAIPMRLFGAEIYVANLIALSMIRELGPLMTAIVLTGRSGSAFAAELGTMKVNEEIDALTTMGLDPMGFLVVPRVIAGLTMTPLLTVFADLVGVLGGSIVLLSLGYPMVTYVNQVLASVTYVDFLGGLIKSFVFGIMIAGVGCLRGLQAQTGASAVGESTTRSVVTGIILIVLIDGAFSVVYFYLGI